MYPTETDTIPELELSFSQAAVRLRSSCSCPEHNFSGPVRSCDRHKFKVWRREMPVILKFDVVVHDNIGEHKLELVHGKKSAGAEEFVSSYDIG
jgi:hypothetical protein